MNSETPRTARDLRVSGVAPRTAHEWPRGLPTAVALGVGASLAACASGGGDGPSFSLPTMPSVASISAAADEGPRGSATELYTRIAGGANSCWFAPAGPLKKDYIYHAEADAPSRGGKAEIVIHIRELGQPNPRGPKAFRIGIDPKDETSATVSTENLKMTEPVAAAMNADVERWSRGELGCKGSTTAMGWGTQPAPPPAVVPKSKAAAASQKTVKKPAAAVPPKP